MPRDDTFPPFDVRPRTDGNGETVSTVEVDAEVLSDTVNTLYAVQLAARDMGAVEMMQDVREARRQLERQIPDLQTNE